MAVVTALVACGGAGASPTRGGAAPSPRAGAMLPLSPLELETDSQALFARVRARAVSGAAALGDELADDRTGLAIVYLLQRLSDADRPGTRDVRTVPVYLGLAMVWCELAVGSAAACADLAAEQVASGEPGVSPHVLEQLEARRRAQWAALAAEPLVRCTLAEVVGHYAPSLERPDPLVRAAAASLIGSIWIATVNRYHALRFDCGDRAAVFVLTEVNTVLDRELTRPQLAVLGWRFGDAASIAALTAPLAGWRAVASP